MWFMERFGGFSEEEKTFFKVRSDKKNGLQADNLLIAWKALGCINEKNNRRDSSSWSDCRVFSKC